MREGIEFRSGFSGRAVAGLAGDRIAPCRSCPIGTSPKRSRRRRRPGRAVPTTGRRRRRSNRPLKSPGKNRPSARGLAGRRVTSRQRLFERVEPARARRGQSRAPSAPAARKQDVAARSVGDHLAAIQVELKTVEQRDALAASLERPAVARVDGLESLEDQGPAPRPSLSSGGRQLFECGR